MKSNGQYAVIVSGEDVILQRPDNKSMISLGLTLNDSRRKMRMMEEKHGLEPLTLPKRNLDDEGVKNDTKR